MAIELLDEVADDYSGEDLRDVDLAEIDLSWLRWDEGTIWPPFWAGRLRQISLEVAPGHWVVQPVDADETMDLLV
ncbi:hypothetical protein [Streptomyces sp. NPDC003480]